MIIGESYFKREEGLAKLCADITNGSGETRTLWFGVEEKRESALTAERADPFLMALAPFAMRNGEDIICRSPVSRRLLYEIRHYLIPVLAGGRNVSIEAEPASDVLHGTAVTTGFSGGVDSMYTLLRHGKDSEYPVTHLAVFNSGVYEGEKYRDTFYRSVKSAEAFAEETGYELIFVDSNIREVLPERFLDVYSFRNMGFALALQGLVSVYLLSSGHFVEDFKMDLHNTASYDLFTIQCCSTESLSFFLSGMEVKRSEKIRALCDFGPSHKWMSPCVHMQRAGAKNCSHCKKCIRDMGTLYALGRLEEYSEIFDVDDFKKNLAVRLGFIFSNSEDLYDDSASVIKNSGAYIPQKAYVFEKQFRKAMDHLQEKIKNNVDP